MLLKDVLDEYSDEHMVAESIEAARELVTTHFDGLPLAIAVARGQNVDTEMTVREYVDGLELGRVHGFQDNVFLALECALEHARQSGLDHVLDITPHASPDQLSIELLRDEDVVRRLCELNLLCRIQADVFSIHRRAQRAARRDRSPKAALVLHETSKCC